ncbi:MAG: hypothetical protein HN929_13375 [Chloroflexi bacterium]|jgi:hypothetical protein|nr:hypothetical protein [Chloroflexota bacterium]MBT7082430.1 hypothetical protein [Chloroflexota bacterium]MBT7290554.1 hypothetical protein [Chloroflexota bacterium]
MLKQKLLMISLIIAMISTFLGTVYIAFRDTAIADSNMMNVGTLNLKTTNVNGVTATITATSMSPGDTIGPSSINLNNYGNINGASLDISLSYSEHDSAASAAPNLQVNKTADQFAAEMTITTMVYRGTGLLQRIPDLNSNGRIDLQDAANADLTGLTGITASDSEFFIISMQLGNVSSDFQADGIDIMINFRLNQ